MSEAKIVFSLQLLSALIFFDIDTGWAGLGQEETHVHWTYRQTERRSSEELR